MCWMGLKLKPSPASVFILLFVGWNQASKPNLITSRSQLPGWLITRASGNARFARQGGN